MTQGVTIRSRCTLNQAIWYEPSAGQTRGAPGGAPRVLHVTARYAPVLTGRAANPIFPGLLAALPPSSAVPTSLPPPLRVHPRLPRSEFYFVAGTVVSDATFYSGPGHYTPAGVNRKVRHFRTFRVRQEDGTEVELSADAYQVQLKEGHRVTLVVAGQGFGYDYVVQFWNHDAPQYSCVVQSTLQVLTFVRGDGCLDSFILAVAAAKVAFIIPLVLGGVVAGAVVGVPVFAIMIARSLRQRARRQRKVEAFRASVLEHLSGIARTLELPADEGKDAVRQRHLSY
jgi:hypothetical protein